MTVSRRGVLLGSLAVRLSRMRVFGCFLVLAMLVMMRSLLMVVGRRLMVRGSLMVVITRWVFCHCVFLLCLHKPACQRATFQAQE